MSGITSESFKVVIFSPDETYQGMKGFDCGDKLLSSYPHKQLKKQVERDFVNALVLLAPDGRFIGFVTITFEQVARGDIPEGTYPYGLPPVVTMMKILMLAIDKEFQKQGWGHEVMGAAFDFILEKTDGVRGIKGVVLDAMPSARQFYESLDFEAQSEALSENGTFRMLISLDKLRLARSQPLDDTA